MARYGAFVAAVTLAHLRVHAVRESVDFRTFCGKFPAFGSIHTVFSRKFARIPGTSLAQADTMVGIEPRVERFLELVQTEYREMPGLQLTKPQMRRFLGVDAMTCDLVLERLEREHFLRRTLKDSYVLES